MRVQWGEAEAIASRVRHPAGPVACARPSAWLRPGAFLIALLAALVTPLAASPDRAAEGPEQQLSGYPAGLYPVYQDGAWGYIDANGRMIIEPRFDAATFFSGGLARVLVDGAYKFINPAGEVVLTPDVAWVGAFSDGLAPARPEKGKPFGYIDKTGKFVIAPQFEQAYAFSDGLAVVSVGTKPQRAEPSWGYIDRSGAFVIEPQFWGARRFSGGVAPVLVDSFVFGKWGYINRQGNMVIEPRFEDALPFSQGLAAVQVGGNLGDWGYIDVEGHMVIEPQFRQVQPFASGLAPVEKTFTDAYYINRIGDRVFPWSDGEYNVAMPFHGALARVANKGGVLRWSTGGPRFADISVLGANWRYVNREGQQVWPPPEAASDKAKSQQGFIEKAVEQYGRVPGTQLPGFIPIYGDAQLLGAAGGYAAYKTNVSAVQVLDFYENWFRNNGWEVTRRAEQIVQGRRPDKPVKIWVAVFPDYFDSGKLRFEINLFVEE